MTDASGLANGSHGMQTDSSGSSSAEFDEQWAYVEKNPDDFAAWERALRAAESVNGGVTRDSSLADTQRVVETYNKFLHKFPLCFGYWKKYVDWHHLLYSAEDALKIFQEGVKGITNSIELWVQYALFKIEHNPEDEDGIRALFEQGCQFVGYHFLSHDFWDKYIEWEERKGNSDKVLAILERVIRLPLHQYNRYFEKYSQLSITRPIPELVTAEELQKLKDEIRNPVVPEGGQAPPPPQTDAEMDQLLRQKIHQLKSELYLKTQEAVMARWVFEEQIKRAYFHVKPLDEAQLTNWRKYLDFEEGAGDPTRIYHLYERCLVACASYEEFWLRYARYAMTSNLDVQGIFHRAAEIFLPKHKTALRLAYAGWQEEQNRPNEAENIYRGILKNLPGHTETVLKFAAFLRRQKRTLEVSQVFDEAVRVAPNGLTKGYLLTEQAKTLFNINKDLDLARASLKSATQKHPDSKMAWIVRFLLEINHGDGNHLRSVWEDVTASSLLKADKLLLGHRYIAYLVEEGRPVAEINKLEAEMAKIQNQPEVDTSRKRSLDEGDGRAAKHAKLDGGADAAAAAGATGAALAPYYDPATAAAWNGSYYGAQGYGDGYGAVAAAPAQPAWDYSQAAQTSWS